MIPKYKFFSIRTLIAIALVLTISSLCSGYRTDQVYHMEKEHQILIKQLDRTVKVKKVADYYMNKNPKLWAHLANYMAEATVSASEEYDVPLKLLVGKDSVESEANPFAKSRTGAKGTSQVDFTAHKETFPSIVTERDKYDPSYNIRCGAFLLKGYIQKYGVRNALHIYNLGEHAFKVGKRNNKYVNNVLSATSDFEYYLN